MNNQYSFTDTYYIGDSPIHGKGVMAARNLKNDEVIGLGIGYNLGLLPYVTPYFGSYINHSYSPDAYLWYYDGYGPRDSLILDRPGWYIRAMQPIKRGQEVTVNYNHTPWYIEGPRPHYR